jgi:hypothetical protein
VITLVKFVALNVRVVALLIRANLRPDDTVRGGEHHG